ncbi:MAG: M3 family oligoendopeptidase [Saprospiraceae bacterium]|nr:M3 family oligoendopeptidase [Saprospiraceae bacterium]
MKFSQYEYERPNLETYKDKFTQLLKDFNEASDAKQQIEIINAINELRSGVDSMHRICSIRHSVDTNNDFYKEENSFFDQRYPEVNEFINAYYKSLLNSKYRADLEVHFGKHLFVIAELTLKTFKPNILDDLKQENKSNTAYRQTKAKAKIEFRGKTYNLPQLKPFELDKDRATRKEATEAKWGYFESIAPEVETIYDNLVKTRHGMAQKLGYENYIGLGYARMQRFDYDANMVANFRKQIQDNIVPIATKLYKRQQKRLGLDSLKYYDEDFQFASGNATPKGKRAWMEAQANTMYKELSKETDEFFSFMMNGELMDLDSKTGKETGGYCTFINTHKAPFIFANFNQTSHDVVVLTHEAGHAFQCFSTSRNTNLYEYLWPTYEACEIHSMSMEFFTWPWMNLFFKEDTDKFKFTHLAESIRFLPYGVAVDEFQHVVYENPDMTPAERNAAWSAIEEKYLPHRDYAGIEFLEKGGFWQRQSHIFGMPFYYIDYVLAQICAFQFWQRSQKDQADAWKDYIHLCKAGGTQSFLDLVKLANLRSPFEEGTVSSVVQGIEDYLDSIDDSNF